MKKPFIILIILLLSKIAIGQTVPNSFDCQLKPGYNTFTKQQVIAFINKTQLENFRLQDKRVTLSFDNDFDVVLFSAKELLQQGLITNVNIYQVTFPPQYKLPHFHINALGQVMAEYEKQPNFKTSNRVRK